MQLPITIELYAGPNDGKEITVRLPVTHSQKPALWQGQIASEGGPKLAPTHYVESPEWSAHFGRPVAIPADYKPRPPQHLAAA